jgi:hypothetical protein
MSAHDYSAVWRTPLAAIAQVPAWHLAEFLATCTPRTRAAILARLGA